MYKSLKEIKEIVDALGRKGAVDLDNPPIIGAYAFINAAQSFHMPDGTKSQNRPTDGQKWYKVDGQGTTETWMWDDHLEQWFNITTSGKPNNNNTGTFTVPKGGQYVINTGHGPIKVILPESASGITVKIKEESIVCECGSEKVGSPNHSSWCAKFTNEP